jgi:hypothetical protein
MPFGRINEYLIYDEKIIIVLVAVSPPVAPKCNK